MRGSSSFTMTPSKKASTGARNCESSDKAAVYSPAANPLSTAGRSASIAACSACSAGSTSAAGSTLPVASSLFFSRFAARLLAAASAAASGNCRKATKASKRASKSSGAVGWFAATASNISLVAPATRPPSTTKPRKRSLRNSCNCAATSAAGAGVLPVTRSESARAASTAASKSGARSSTRRPSNTMRSKPRAERRRPNGSLVPLGRWPSAKMPASVSSLSASANTVPVRVVGNTSPANRGK